MEKAWAKQRQDARDAYEAYLRKPWYSPDKLGDLFLRSIAIFFAVLLIGPIVLVILYTALHMLIDGNMISFFITLAIGGGFAIAIYRIIKSAVS